MKRLAYILLVLVAMPAVFQSASVLAAITTQINYQGKLTNASDVTVANGSYNFRFRLCTASDCTGGGDPLWTETRCYSPDSGVTCDGTGSDQRLVVASGQFNAMLGGIASLAAINFNQALYLEVQVGGSAATPSWETLAPRKLLGAVPGAFEALKLGGKAETALATLADDETITGAYSFTKVGTALSVTNTASLGTLNLTNALGTLYGGTGATSLTNLFELNTHTTGNYVASANTSALTGLTGGSAGSEAAALTLAFDYSQALTGDVGLATNAAVFGQSGLVFEGLTADTIETYFVVTDPTSSDKTITFGDLSGTVTVLGNTTTGSGSIVLATSPSLTTPTLGAATATSIAIGANTLDTNEWANLDAVNQTLATTSTPQFARLGLGAAADATHILTITSTSTTDLSKALNVTHTGGITGTGYAGYFSKTGTSTTNVGLYATASGATNNYAAIFDAGNVGIGTTTPATRLSIGGVGEGNGITLDYGGAKESTIYATSTALNFGDHQIKLGAALATQSVGAGDDWSISTTDLLNSDNTYADISATGVFNSPDLSEWLQATQFGFEVPSGATITGIKAYVEANDGGANTDLIGVQLMVNGVRVGNDLESGLAGIGTADTTIAYGNSTQLWGLSLTSADVNDNDFGVALQFKAAQFAAGIHVDQVQLEVFYVLVTDGLVLSSGGGSVVLESNGLFAPLFVVPASGNNSMAAGTGSQSVGLGDDWNNVTLIGKSDDGRAGISCCSFDSPDVSEWLQSSEHGFAIPLGATILGIKARIEALKITTPNASIIGVELVINGVRSGNDQETGATTLSTSDVVYTYGGSNNTWGLSLTLADVNDRDFGVAVQLKADAADATVGVDYIELQVFYANGGQLFVTQLSTGTIVGDESGLVNISGNIGNTQGNVIISDGLDIAESGIQKNVGVWRGALCVDNDDSGCPTTAVSGRLYSIDATVLTDDLAEYMGSNDPLEPGDLVAVDPNYQRTGAPIVFDDGEVYIGRRSEGQGKNLEDFGVSRASKESGQRLLGIVSTAPGITLGGYENVTEDDYPIALAGRVPTKVSAENGPIEIGDPLTSSSTPGVAMKATEPGMIVGFALESFGEEVRSQNSEVSNDNADDLPTSDSLILNSASQTGTVLAFVNVIYYVPPVELASVEEAASEAWESLFDGLVRMVRDTWDLIVAKLTTNELTIQNPADGAPGLAGSGILPASAASVVITNANVLASSKIFVTFKGALIGPWWISEQQVGGFTIAVSGPQQTAVPFDYFILQVSGPTAPPAQAPNSNIQISNNAEPQSSTDQSISDIPDTGAISEPAVESIGEVRSQNSEVSNDNADDLPTSDSLILNSDQETLEPVAEPTSEVDDIVSSMQDVASDEVGNIPDTLYEIPNTGDMPEPPIEPTTPDEVANESVNLNEGDSIESGESIQSDNVL